MEPHSSAGTANGRVSSDGSVVSTIRTTVRTTIRALAVGPTDQVEATASSSSCFPQSMQPISSSEVTSV